MRRERVSWILRKFRSQSRSQKLFLAHDSRYCHPSKYRTCSWEHSVHNQSSNNKRRRPKVTFSRVSAESKMRFDRDEGEETHSNVCNVRVMSVSVDTWQCARWGKSWRPEKKRLTATQTPHKWDWVSAAILGNPLSFSLLHHHPPPRSPPPRNPPLGNPWPPH